MRSYVPPFSMTCLVIIILYFCLQDELQKYVVGSDTVDPIITEIVTTVSAAYCSVYIIQVHLSIHRTGCHIH